MIRALAAALALIPIGGGQHLALSCKGTGTPTVVFESGLGVYSGTWLAVQQRVAKTTRACIYDRRRLGASSPAPSGRTSADMVQDLQTMLQNAHLTPPFVLVGASFGGLNVQLYGHTTRTTLQASSSSTRCNGTSIAASSCCSHARLRCNAAPISG